MKACLPHTLSTLAALFSLTVLSAVGRSEISDIQDELLNIQDIPLLPYSRPLLPGWSYIGCWSNDRKYPQLGGFSFADPNLTTSSCISYCDSKRYAYAGVQYGHMCFCGTALKSKSHNLDPATFCNVPCGGNKGGSSDDILEDCGGTTSMDVFLNPDYKVYANPGPDCSQYTGCFNQPVRRALPYAIPVVGGSLEMTVAKCVDACKSDNYTYAGLQNSDYCFCGNEIDASSSRLVHEGYACSYRCTGNVTEWCGGARRMSIYTLNVGCEPS
ncbi:WSC domain-containing protein [Xylariaceae sp. FL0255]|nr:WSC domain-containing protein [Xylariaceae sp. FL0255]